MTSSHRLSGGVQALAAFAVAALVLAFLPLLAGVADAAHPENETERFRGENRFHTAALIAQQFLDEFPAADLPPGDEDDLLRETDTVIVATGQEFADALAAASLSGFSNAPIVLVASTPDAIPAETEEFLENNPDLTQAIIVGQTLAVGPAVEARLEEDFGLEVTRLGGQNRFETAKAIGDYIAEQGGEFGTYNDMTTAILATGERFPDALASGPLAFGGIHPILLSPIAIAEPEALAFIDEHDIEQLVIAGGTNAISAEAEATFRDAGVEIIRVNGPIDTDEDETIYPTSSVAPEGRVSTAVGLAQLTRVVLGNEFNHESETGTVARGDDFADALVVAPLVGLRSGDLLLSNAPEPAGGDPAAFLSNTTVEAVASGCTGYGNPDEPFVIPGGFLAVTEAQEALIQDLILCDEDEEPFVPVDSLFFLVEDEAEEIVEVEETSYEVELDADLVSDIRGYLAVDDEDPVLAAGAEVTWQYFTEATTEDADAFLAWLADQENEDRPDGIFYVEEGTVYILVTSSGHEGEEPLTLDEDGEATLELTLDSEVFAEGEDRLLHCAPSDEENEEDGCVDEFGDARDEGWATIVAEVLISEAEENGEA